MAEIITKQNLSSCEESRGGWWRGGSLWGRWWVQSVCVCVCVPAISSVSMRGGGWGGLNILVMSSSGSGGSPLLCRWAFSCCRLWRYWREGHKERGVALEKEGVGVGAEERKEKSQKEIIVGAWECEEKGKGCNKDIMEVKRWGKNEVRKWGRGKQQSNRKERSIVRDVESPKWQWIVKEKTDNGNSNRKEVRWKETWWWKKR